MKDSEIYLKGEHPTLLLLVIRKRWLKVLVKGRTLFFICFRKSLSQKSLQTPAANLGEARQGLARMEYRVKMRLMANSSLSV